MIPPRLDCLFWISSVLYCHMQKGSSTMEAGAVEPSPRGLVVCPPRQKPAFTKTSGNPGEAYLVGQKTCMDDGSRGPPGAEGAAGRQWDGAVGTISMHKPVEGIYSVSAAGETLMLSFIIRMDGGHTPDLRVQTSPGEPRVEHGCFRVLLNRMTRGWRPTYGSLRPGLNFCSSPEFSMNKKNS